MRYFRKDPFGKPYWLRSIVCTWAGLITWPGLNWTNKLKVYGTEHLDSLPETGVLFVSNHQTYYTDVIAMYHVFGSHKWGLKGRLINPLYLLSLRTNTCFVAAEETMKHSGLLPKLLALAGAVTVKRTWRSHGTEVEREVDFKEVDNIKLALQDGWVITFPQGTTKPWSPGRKGTALLIKEEKPIVVPVVINGFRRAFDKKGLRFKKRKTQLSITFKAPLNLDYNDSPEEILDRVMDGIEQSERFKFKHYQTR